ncbi:MAG: hypothetical protein K2X44_04080, partial [Magnetospirillum sp.]|nr:hypothetical protein [Magnetospirillum sp.]
MNVAAVASCQPSPQAFSALMKEIGHKATGWHALLVVMSRLPVSDKRTALSQDVVGCIEGACTQPHGVLVLPNRDVLALVRDQHGASMQPLGDLVGQTLEAQGITPASTFIRRFNLERELSQFIALVSGVDTTKVASPRISHSAATAIAALPVADRGDRILPKDVAKIEKMFYKANVGNFLRN